jgi:hypothetical protein
MKPAGSSQVLLGLICAVLAGCDAGMDAGAGTPQAGAGGAGGGAAGPAVPADSTAGSHGSAGVAGVASPDAGNTAGARALDAAVAGSGSDPGPDAGAVDDREHNSAAALAALEDYLARARDARPPLGEQPFATVPLLRPDAERAARLLWDDYAAFVRQARAGEVGATETQAATVRAGASTLRYYMARRGAEPAGGRSLFISMHGGGNAPAATNDQQWRNQIQLVSGYMPQDALWVAPRAPIDDWNMWFVPAIEALFDRLITNLIVFEGVNPNKVYLTGYSAGGDGVYQLGPRMADRWAGAVMSAGHPNDASPLNLRNVAFAIHVGGNDSAYNRNTVAAEWGARLDRLAEGDPDGYPHEWRVHPGLPHWMNLADAVAIPFVQRHTRDPIPSKVVWRQSNVTQPRFYWLAVEAEDARQGTEVTAAYSGDTVTLSSTSGLSRLRVRLTDAMIDLDRPVTVEHEGRELFTCEVERTIAVLARTLDERGDPALMFCSEVTVAW